MNRWLSLLLALALCVMQSAPAIAQGFIPPSGGGSGPPPVEKLTTADVFSDWLVSGCVPSFGSVMHTFAGELAYTFECKISSDDQYLFVEGYDGAGAYIRIIKVRISDWSIVASSDIAFAGQNYGDGSNIQLSADGAFLYTTVSTGNPIVAVKMSTADLSIVNQTNLPSEYYTDFYSTGNTDLSPDGSKFFVRAYDSGNSHAHVVALNSSNMAISTDQDFGTIQLFSIAAIDNTHVVTTDFNVSPNFNELTIPGGAVTTLCTLDSSLYRNVVRQNATTFIVANRYDDAKGAVGTVDISGTPSQTGSAGTGSTSIVFNGNALAAGSVHAFAGDTTGQNPLHAYAYTPGASSFASTFTLANPSGEIEGLAPNSDESHLYCGIDGNLTTSGVVDFSLPSLTITIPSGVAYSGGNRVTPSAVAHTFGANKDTYLSVNSTGAYVFNAVDNGDPQPTITGLLLAKIVSGASTITAVTSLAATEPTITATLTALPANAMTTDTDQNVLASKYFRDLSLHVQNTVDGANFVTIAADSQPTTSGNVAIPDLSGLPSHFVLTHDSDFQVLWPVVFPLNYLYLKDQSDAFQVDFGSSGQSSNAFLMVPDLHGQSDTVGTLKTAQTFSGVKTFAPNGVVLQDINLTPLVLHVNDQIGLFTLAYPVLAADDTIMTLGTAQTLTGVKTFSNGLVSAGPSQFFGSFESNGTSYFDANAIFQTQAFAQFNDSTNSGRIRLKAPASMASGTYTVLWPNLTDDDTLMTVKVPYPIGTGISIKAGSNAKIGTGTLSGGTLTVNNTSITANSIVLLTGRGGTITNLGYLYEDVSSRVTGTSFVVKSSNVLDAQNFGYVIIEATP